MNKILWLTMLEHSDSYLYPTRI